MGKPIRVRVPALALTFLFGSQGDLSAMDEPVPNAEWGQSGRVSAATIKKETTLNAVWNWAWRPGPVKAALPHQGP